MRAKKGKGFILHPDAMILRARGAYVVTWRSFPYVRHEISHIAVLTDECSYSRFRITP